MTKKEKQAKQIHLWRTDLNWLNQYFLRSLIKSKPYDLSLGLYLDIIFGINYRSVEFYTCIKEIRLYGACWSEKRLSARQRMAIEQFKAGQTACIRVDEREKVVTIESKFGCIDVTQERWKKEYELYFTKRVVPDLPGHRNTKPRAKE